MKRLIYGFALIIFALSISWSDVTVQVLDISKRLVRLTYDVADDQVGNRLFIFPQGGFVHDGPFESFQVESVFDPNTKEELNCAVQRVEGTGAPQLRIQYRNPVPDGGRQLLSITVHVIMPERDLSIDDQGRLTLSLETSHPFTLAVPEGYYVTYCNQPVWIFERASVQYVQQKDTTLRLNTVTLRRLPSKS